MYEDLKEGGIEASLWVHIHNLACLLDLCIMHDYYLGLKCIVVHQRGPVDNRVSLSGSGGRDNPEAAKSLHPTKSTSAALYLSLFLTTKKLRIRTDYLFAGPQFG
jgi:hypothetical protein